MELKEKSYIMMEMGGGWVVLNENGPPETTPEEQTAEHEISPLPKKGLVCMIINNDKYKDGFQVGTRTRTKNLLSSFKLKK